METYLYLVNLSNEESKEIFIPLTAVNAPNTEVVKTIAIADALKKNANIDPRSLKVCKK
ncbi:hypothetical protein LCGC14_1261100 [marine sediment metagenome]|uniref:Uncharacterized protein n=1 Tax=marine sediment metagenome TaxID=412755 RepID=A0A0F9P3Z4_9ZZZZ